MDSRPVIGQLMFFMVSHLLFLLAHGTLPALRPVLDSGKSGGLRLPLKFNQGSTLEM